MNIFRITKEKYAHQLAASGNEARWNYKGEKVIYTASSRSLASLELMVHLSGVQLVVPYKIVVIKVPASIRINEVLKRQLPENWSGLSPYKETQRLGSSWLKSTDSSLLKVPSSIVNEEFNYLINVNHPDVKKFSIIDIEDHLFDRRLIEKFKT